MREPDQSDPVTWVWTVSDGGFPFTDVLVSADPRTSVGGVARALGMDPQVLAPDGAGHQLAVDVLAPTGAFVPSRPGPIAVTDGQLTLRVRGGPLAGAVVPLGEGSHSLGRGKNCSIRIADPWLSRRPIELIVRSGSVEVAPGDNNAARVNGRQLTQSTTLVEGDVLESGSSVFGFSGQGVHPGDVVRTGSELAFNRPARIRPTPPQRTVVVPGASPDGGDRVPVPWAVAMVPIISAGLFAFVMHNPLMLLLAAASPALVVANFVSHRRDARRRQARQHARWRSAAALAGARTDRFSDEERVDTWRRRPDPAEVRILCASVGDRLWERRVTDGDALELRLGVGTGPLPVKFEGWPVDRLDTLPTVAPVPISVDLRAVGVFGVAGPTGVARSLARWIVLQLAVNRSPRDLAVAVICDEGDGADWAWSRWLPHLRTERSGSVSVRIGNDENTRALRVAELANEVTARRRRHHEEPAQRFVPEVVVVIDGARRYRTVPGMATILRDGPGVGIFVVGLDDDRARLPEECGAELRLDLLDPTIAGLWVSGGSPSGRLLLDGLDGQTAEECARGIAPLRHVGGVGDLAEVPHSVRLLDLLGIAAGRPDAVITAWSAAASPATVVGVCNDGEVVFDLDRDGPHALVAGTTGSGKSEFLQTLVAGLAVRNRPDALSFLLVDYKGGSSFADCARLPHTVGLVTDLDGPQTARALRSLDAELKRRERQLRDLGVKDVADAWAMKPGAAARNGLARLVIVIDEFAELARELPEFVTGLVRVARLGRSLGVHLVLATQRPAGVISAEMQANIGLRVALRVTDKSDSQEVLGAPDAAFVTADLPGRAFLRRGAGAHPVMFQCARVSGSRSETAGPGLRPPTVTTIGWAELGLVPVAAAESGPTGAETDLAGLVDSIAQAAVLVGASAPPSPWLAPLPAVVSLDGSGPTDLGIEHRDVVTAEPTQAEARTPAPEDRGVAFGRRDEPLNQSQPPLRFRLEAPTHVLVAGSARSGRSTFVRTVIAALIRRWSADDLHIFGADFGGGVLLPIRDLPHCGAVVTARDPSRLARLLDRLAAELARRADLLADGGWGDVVEQRGDARADTGGGTRPSASGLPFLLLVIDRWEGVLASSPLEQSQALRDRLVQLLRDGPALGLRVIVTGDRSLLTDRISAFIGCRYVLRLDEPDDYRLVGVRPGSVPGQMRPGRGFEVDTLTEVQIAVLGEDPSGRAQSDALRAEVAHACERHAETDFERPLRVDALPPRIGLTAARALLGAPVGAGHFNAMIGVGGDELHQMGFEFAAATAAVVMGPPGSGRSTTLVVATHGFHRSGVATLVVAAPGSVLAVAAEVLALEQVCETGVEAAEKVGAWASEHTRCAIVVDDASLIQGTDLDEALVELLRQARPGALALVAATTPSNLAGALRGLVAEVGRCGQALLLSPTGPLEGSSVGVPIPRELLGLTPPGRGLLLRGGRYTPVQVPIAAELGRGGGQ